VRNRGSLGIGLALVRQLVDLREGRIEVASDGIGRGSRFRICLPLHSDPAPDSTDQDERNADQPLSGLRVLVVDDMADTVDSFRSLLELKGARVLAAHGGAEALRIADDQPIDLLLSDLGMPEIDSNELIRRLRRQERVRRLPAIAISGYSRPSDVRRAIDSGFDLRLAKPVFVEPLLAAIGRARSMPRQAAP
jgi:two-component system, chemotaxis family, CheB/CheR fusion protein